MRAYNVRHPGDPVTFAGNDTAHPRLPGWLFDRVTGYAERRRPGLARELAGYTPGHPQTCVSASSNTNLRVIDRATLAYGYGRTIYVNRLVSACPALDPTNTLIVDVQGGQYCLGDRVRGLEPGGIIPGPSCNLQDWVPYRR